MTGFTKRVRSRLQKRVGEAFSFMIATMWTEVFDSMFSLLVDDTDSIYRKILYALVFTLVASFVASFTDDD